MGSNKAMIVAGLGFRTGVSAEAITAILRDAAARADTTIDKLASPGFKLYEPGLHAAAQLMTLPLLAIDDDALARVQPLCPTRSASAARHTGHASIAEAAALAGAGPNARLLLLRIAHPTVTCALATS